LPIALSVQQKAVAVLSYQSEELLFSESWPSSSAFFPDAFAFFQRALAIAESLAFTAEVIRREPRRNARFGPEDETSREGLPEAAIPSIVKLDCYGFNFFL